MTSGMAWHVYHDSLLGWTFSLEERQAYIREKKPVEEREPRLRLLRLVKGDLPPSVVQAVIVLVQARAARDVAWTTYSWDYAWAGLEQALIANMPAILELHAQECPDCPWDGKTIFPGREE